MKKLLPLFILPFALGACGGSGSNSDTTSSQKKDIAPEALQIVAQSKQIAKDHASHLYTIFLNNLIFGINELRFDYERQLQELQKQNPSSVSIQSIRAKVENFEIHDFSLMGNAVSQLQSEIQDIYLQLRAEENQNTSRSFVETSLFASTKSEFQAIIDHSIKICEEGFSSNISKNTTSLIPLANTNSLFTNNSTSLSSLDILLLSGNTPNMPSSQHEIADYLIHIDQQGFSPLKALSSSEEDVILLSTVDADKKAAAVEYIFNNKANAETVRIEFKSKCSTLLPALLSLKSIEGNGTLSKLTAAITNIQQATVDSTDLNLNSQKAVEDLEKALSAQNRSEANQQSYLEIQKYNSFQSLLHFYKSMTDQKALDIIRYNFLIIQNRQSGPAPQTSENQEALKATSKGLSDLLYLARELNTLYRKHPMSKNIQPATMQAMQELVIIVESYIESLFIDGNQQHLIRNNLETLKEDINKNLNSKDAETMGRYIEVLMTQL